MRTMVASTTQRYSAVLDGVEWKNPPSHSPTHCRLGHREIVIWDNQVFRSRTLANWSEREREPFAYLSVYISIDRTIRLGPIIYIRIYKYNFSDWLMWLGLLLILSSPAGRGDPLEGDCYIFSFLLDFLLLLLWWWWWFPEAAGEIVRGLGLLVAERGPGR